MTEGAEDRATFLLDREAAAEIVHGEAHRDGGAARGLFQRVLDELAQQAHAMIDAAAVGVGTLIVSPRQEVQRQRPVMTRVHIDDVVARLQGAPHRGAMLRTKAPDILQRHRLGLHRHIGGRALQARRPERRHPAVKIAGAEPEMRELDCGERAVGANGIGREAMTGDVVLIPEPIVLVAHHVGRRVDLAHSRADDAPAAFGLHRAQRRSRVRHGVPHTGTVGSGDEAVAGDARSDRDRLEQRFVSRVHGALVPG